MFLYWWMVLLVGVACGCLCAYVASEKRRSSGAWFVTGFFLNILALIALAAIPSLTQEELEQREARDREEAEQRDNQRLNGREPRLPSLTQQKLEEQDNDFLVTETIRKLLEREDR